MTTLIFDHAHPNVFQSTFNFPESVPTCKNEAFSSFYFRDIVDLKILESDWPRAFWPISQKPDFSQVRDLYKTKAINMKFFYTPNSEKNNY